MEAHLSLEINYKFSNGPLTRYIKLRVVHAPGMRGTFSPPPRGSDPGMHHGTCVTHVPWCTPGSLTSGIIYSRWRRMRNPQFYVSEAHAITKLRARPHNLEVERGRYTTQPPHPPHPPLHFVQCVRSPKTNLIFLIGCRSYDRDKYCLQKSLIYSLNLSMDNTNLFFSCYVIQIQGKSFYIPKTMYGLFE